MTAQQNDFSFVNTGNLWLLTPRTQAAETWTTENLPEEVTMWGISIVVEARYVDRIVAGIEDDGLTVGSN